MPDIYFVEHQNEYDLYRETDTDDRVYYVHDTLTFYYEDMIDACYPEPMPSSALDEIVGDHSLDASAANTFVPTGADFGYKFVDCEACGDAKRESDTYTTADDDYVCDDCAHDYTLCHECERQVSLDDSNTVTNADGYNTEEACHRCMEGYTSWCDACEVRYWDRDYEYHEHDGDDCDCEPHEPEFALSTEREDIGQIRSDETYEVTLGKDTIPSRVLHDISDYIMGAIRETAPFGPMWKTDFEALSCVLFTALDTGTLYRTEEGTWAKRFRSLLYKATKIRSGVGYSLPAPILSEVGRRLSEEVGAGTTYEVQVTRDLNRSADELGNGGSCWWTDYSESRCALKSNAGFGFIEPRPNGFAASRAWVLPCKIRESEGYHVLHPTHREAQAYLVFNAYGNFEERVGPRAFAALLGWKMIGSVDFDPNPMYINGGRAYLVVPPSNETPLHAFSASGTRRMPQHGGGPSAEEESDTSDPIQSDPSTPTPSITSVPLGPIPHAVEQGQTLNSDEVMVWGPSTGHPRIEDMSGSAPVVRDVHGFRVGDRVRATAATHRNAHRIVGHEGVLTSISNSSIINGVLHRYSVSTDNGTHLTASAVERIESLDDVDPAAFTQIGYTFPL